MSRVTNVILTAACAEDIDDNDHANAMESVNQWLAEKNYGEFARVDGNAGGTKAMEAFVFLGAFNYLDLVAFLAVVGAAPWQQPENVRVFVKQQEDERFDVPPNG